ncbi:MAG: cellulose biosynthesis cyclic di-GMP-binding regulatory protein BcsB [Gammaproteobacteria bacterium]|nr:cellulose biosynthesis cyclic di-GMP-binding regulatory protein BcsB [Gammaproteobacteria bacterium]
MRPYPADPRRRTRAAGALALGAALALLTATAAGPIAQAAARTATPARPAPRAAAAITLLDSPRSFASLGFGRSIRLSGDHNSVTIPFSVRLDEVARRARLQLRFTASPALLPELSHVKVSLNGQMLATVPLPKESAGTAQLRDVELDPRLISDYNELRLQLIGHYTLDCEDSFHDSIWFEISPDSAIVLGVERVTLANDLALLPVPFFDHRDNQPVEVPFVFAATPEPRLLHSAGIIASWLGSLADYRATRFPLAIGTLPARHAIALLVNGQTLPGVLLEPAQAPTLRLLGLGADGAQKLLVIQGRDAAEVDKAAQALVLGQAVLTGPSAQVDRLDLGPPRPAYQGPRWIPTDRPVKFSELISDGAALQARGFTPNAIRVPLRVPADLYAGFSRGVPIWLRYRYSPPIERNSSTLDISVNDRYLQTFRLEPSGKIGGTDRFSLPLIDSQDWLGPAEVRVPAFQLGSDNELQFQFRFEPAKQGRCRSTPIDNMHAAIDPDSTIDLSDLPHYKKMPDLAAFVASGYPFTRFADLGESTVVLADGPVDAGEAETYLALLARFGRWSGVPALRHELVQLGALRGRVDRDLLLLGRALAQSSALRRGHDLPAMVAAGSRMAQLKDPVFSGAYDLRAFHLNTRRSDGQLELTAAGDLGALISFESPLRGDRTVVAVTGATPGGLRAAMAALADPGIAPGIRGNVAFVRDRNVSSFEIGASYYVGDLGWWQVIWFHMSRHPVLLVSIALLGSLLVAMLLYRALRRRAARRLAAQD